MFLRTIHIPGNVGGGMNSENPGRRLGVGFPLDASAVEECTRMKKL